MATIAVLGLGPSIGLFPKDQSVSFDLTIGVNDIYKHIRTDVIVCVDKPTAFTPERLRVINQSTPNIFYSQIVTWDSRPDFRKIKILPGYPDRYINLDVPGYWKSFCSPFIAVQIAWREHAGTEIHLYGVDLTNHPRLDKILCKQIKLHFANLRSALNQKGCQLIVHGNGILAP